MGPACLKFLTEILEMFEIEFQYEGRGSSRQGDHGRLRTGHAKQFGTSADLDNLPQHLIGKERATD